MPNTKKQSQFTNIKYQKIQRGKQKDSVRKSSLNWTRQKQEGKVKLNPAPPYVLPSMKSLNAPDAYKNGYTVVSTFSGTGGGCLGLRMAGYTILWANDFLPHAQESYANNHPTTQLDHRDIRDIHVDDILSNIGMNVGDVDVLEGSPPCSAFSIAGPRGQRPNNWSKVKAYSILKQNVDDLFWQFARILKGLQPKTFIAENVDGLITGVNKGIFLAILQALQECGYIVQARVINAALLGVPQQRRRMIFIGVRTDLAQKFNVQPVYPSPLPYMHTFQQAIEGLTSPGPYLPIRPETTIYQAWLRARPGQSFDDARRFIGNTRTMYNHTKISLGRPSHTVTTKPSLYHPIEPRTLGINEVKRISSFPDDFVLHGSYLQQYERIGRAVPPLMYYHIGKTIAEKVLDVIYGKTSNTSHESSLEENDRRSDDTNDTDDQYT